jgi:hypothetical protein
MQVNGLEMGKMRHPNCPNQMKTKNKKMFAGKIILFEKRLGQMALMR